MLFRNDFIFWKKKKSSLWTQKWLPNWWYNCPISGGRLASGHSAGAWNAIASWPPLPGAGGRDGGALERGGSLWPRPSGFNLHLSLAHWSGKNGITSIILQICTKHLLHAKLFLDAGCRFSDFSLAFQWTYKAHYHFLKSMLSSESNWGSLRIQFIFRWSPTCFRWCLRLSFQGNESQYWTSRTQSLLGNVSAATSVSKGGMQDWAEGEAGLWYSSHGGSVHPTGAEELG